MMLGDPETVITEFLGPGGNLDRRPQRIRGRQTVFDRAFVEKTKEVGHGTTIRSLVAKFSL
jgi:hypothetical protein